MANIICLDFDGTVVANNVTKAVLEQFASPGWRDLEESYQAGILTVEQYAQAALDLVDATAEEIQAFARSIAIPRAGLGRLVSWADRHEWLLAVVSNGFDISVCPVLDGIGLGRAIRHTGRARRGYRWRVRYLSPRGIELQSGFKASYVAAYRAAGDFVVWVGDGPSDVDAAMVADAVFARDVLWTGVAHRRTRVFPFETFDDVVAVLEREAGSWPGSIPRRDGISPRD